MNQNYTFLSDWQKISYFLMCHRIVVYMCHVLRKVEKHYSGTMVQVSAVLRPSVCKTLLPRSWEMKPVTPHERLGSVETELFPFLIGHVLGPVMGTKLAGDFLCFAFHLPCCSKIILLHLESVGRQESRNEKWALS